MRFLEPSALVWAAVLAGVLALYLFRRRPRRMVVSALSFFKTLSAAHQESAWLRFLKRLLAILLSVLLVSAAVGWLAQLTFSESDNSLKTVVLLIDRSAPMAVRPSLKELNRLESGWRSLRARLANLPGGTGVVVIAYDTRPEILLGRTLNRHAVQSVLDKIVPLPISGNSERALALARSLAALEQPAAIWHLTDQLPMVNPPGTASATGLLTSSAAAGISGEGQSLDVASAKRSLQAPPPLSAASAASVPLAVSAEADSAFVGARAAIPVITIVSPLPVVVNAGITAFHLRRQPLEHDRYEAFVQVEGVSPEEVDAELEIRMDDRLTGIRKVPIGAGARTRLLLPFAASECSRLRLSLHLPGDMLTSDNAISVPIPGSWPVHVAWVCDTPEPYTELALRALADSGLEITHLKPAQWPPRQMPDVAIFQNTVPPAGAPPCALILLNPTAPLQGLPLVPLATGGIPVDRLRVHDETHPVLYGIASARLALTQTAALSADSVLEPLWTGPAGPLLCAGEINGKRVAAMGFSPLESERLVLTPSYPLLLGNALFWCAENSRQRSQGKHLKTGTLLELGSADFVWTDLLSQPAHSAVSDVPSILPVKAEGAPAPAFPMASTATPPVVVSTSGSAVSAAPASGWKMLDAVGAWRTSDGQIGSAALLDVESTLLISTGGNEEQVDTSLLPAPGRFLLWFLLVVVVVEFWMYHRHAVY